MIKKILKTLIVSVVVLVALAFGVVQYHKSPQIFEPSIAGLYHEEDRKPAEDSLRQLSQGELVGLEDNYDTYAWLGVPYAKPPKGDLRWRAPEHHNGWSGRLTATEYGASCLQFWGVVAGVEGKSGDIVGQEDCLTLNIWAPKTASKDRKVPTMVWIHGGGNDSGTGSVYQGHHLAGSKDLVIVTINYRVGLLGWFSHEAVRQTSSNPEDASGNFGTLDIIQALKWVQNNIAEFGGDPDNVTIFGESAGARNVYSMMASPLANGLFHKAIAQSGTVDTTLRTLAEDFPEEPNIKAVSGLKNSSNGLIELVLKQQQPEKSSLELRKEIRSMTAEQIMRLMRKKSAKELMQLASDNTGTPGYIRVARVIRDGHVIPEESLLTLFKDTRKYNSVPLITGSNRDEQKVFMARNPEYVDFKFGAIPQVKEPEKYQNISDFVSLNWKAGAVDEPAKVISSNGGASVYAYRFDWDDMMQNFLIDLPKVLGAAHGMEINYVFGDFHGGPPFHITYSRANADSRRAMANSMMSYWAQFAHTGDPGQGREGNLPEWNKWQARGDNLMVFDAENEGGVRMQEIRTNVADIKQRLATNTLIGSLEDRCRGYASLFLHGYQTSDFWSEQEYLSLGCKDYPVGSFR